MSKQNKVESVFEQFLFSSRWIMAPFYLGLIVALIVLLVAFTLDVIHGATHLIGGAEKDIIIWVLSLIDLSLAANLVLMVIFAGYENFVSKMDIVGHPDRPDWMGTINFSAMKLKLVASIVAISAIHLLKAFMEIGDTDKTNLMWLVIVHVTFVASGVLLALMDYITSKTKDH